MYQNKKGGEVLGRDEFADGRNKSIEEWNSKARNLENPAGDYDWVGNHGLGKENK